MSLRSKTTQASHNNHANSQDEDPAALQNETCVLGVGVRIRTGVLPRCKYTPRLPQLARNARLAQAHIPAKHHAAAPEGDCCAMRESESVGVERRPTAEH